MALINTATVHEHNPAPPAPLYEWRDAAGNTWQMTEQDGRRAGYTRTSDQPLDTGHGRPTVTYDVTGVTPARQVGDASRA